MGFFNSKPPISQDELDWLIACFAWLRTVLDDADIRPELVLPSNTELKSTANASEMFEVVRRLCGMENWPCRLEKVDVDRETGDQRIVTEGSAACGTFSFENGEAVIRYSSDMLHDPDGLAATFAHELCHYLLADVGDPPGGPDLIEHSTDCAAAYLGFGVLLANNARNFAQWTDGEWSGWQSSTKGYLSEQSLVTAVALFVSLHGHDAASAKQELKPYLQQDFARASKALSKSHPDIQASMENVDFLGWNFT